MGKRELKKQYPNLTVSLVDVLGLLDPTPTKKVLPFLCKQMNDYIQHTPNQKRHQPFVGVGGVTPSNELDELLFSVVDGWSKPKIETINEFIDHLQNNRLVDNDINNYRNWEDINVAINDAEIKHGIKTKKNKIVELFRDEKWLVMKPLTVESSLSYGSGTKWCTASEGNPTYFHKYSRDGVLIYVINRKENIKYAFYSSPKEFSVWTAEDARIDSMESKVPFDLLLKIREWGDYEKYGVNYDHMDDEDKEKLMSKKLRPLTRDFYDIVVDGPLVTEGQDETIDERVPLMENAFTGYLESTIGYYETTNNLLRRMESEQQLVGLGDSVHGEISQNEERTWENPYPQGPGGGFDTELTMPYFDDELPANRETDETMGVEYEDEQGGYEIPQRG